MNKSFYIFLFIITFCCEAKTQTNLVYNGDFEIYDTCPSGLTQVINCSGWNTANTATPDYFNSCANYTTFVSVPSNAFGIQYARNGNAYMGIYVYDISNFREYLQSRLNSKLTYGHKYLCSFYVNCGEYSSIAIKTVGAYFSSNFIFRNSAYSPFIMQPQIEYVGSYLKDTSNWVNIMGNFIADGTEEYITIGNFRDTLNPDTLRLKISNPIEYPSYYYVDEITLIDITPKDCEDFSNTLPNVFTPNSDGVNDVFSFEIADSLVKITIYNRWGIRVFETETLNHYWDGRTTSGEACNDGCYYYIINTERKDYKGMIQLVR